MAGLVPAIHVLTQGTENVDALDKPGHDGRRKPASASSLRAQRSNPDCPRGKILDCFAALAMTD
ncbi:hypothetical protein BST63_29715 [Bradyrhizobium canariense]|uniref:Transposase n=1 Tax=Bradyrhizobium canariense TaxID=255045 RepID=A0ABX3WWA5_9BRAD|nr:hypothetical protein BSR47_33905 [Bradyrhizobium canariense]OSJ23096.1 hypothetical protein BST63_29715 [Bradyrhizobium canariense]